MIMLSRWLLPLGFMLLAGAAALPLAPARPSMAAPAAPKGFLPDSVVLARVNGNAIRVKDYVASYFRGSPEFRPNADSTGRVEFLGTLIDKEVLAQTARETKRTLGFEQRLKMREDTETALANALFQRAVLDSATVTDDEVQRAYETYKYDKHLQQIMLDDRATADRVRADLAAKKLTWAEALRRYPSSEKDSTRRNDLGWVNRANLPPMLGMMVAALDSGQVSPVLTDIDGSHIFYARARRPSKIPPFNLMRMRIRADLMNDKSAVLARRLQRQVAASIGMTYDTTNIAWAAAHFGDTRSFRNDKGTTTIEINAGLPQFTDADTGRILARHRDGRLSLGAFLHAYSDLSPLSRPAIGDFEAFISQVDGVVLMPYMSQLAIARGLDKDPIAVETIESRREQMLVESLYQDSVTARIYITPAQRRKYYEDHIAQYHTYANVRFAAIVRTSKEGADSVVAMLKAGKTPAQILRADSLMGLTSGSIQDRREDDHGAPYHNILMHELRPGQWTVMGPDKQGDWLVLEVLTYDAGKQLSYKEAESMIDESLQNMQAEKLLKAFIARQKKKRRIESHPELVMKVLLQDPTALN
jgi:peptidyl-prolyl cis-trans isomerase C